MPVKVTGVSFDGAHSYNDWGLKLKSVSIGVPKAKTVYVSVWIPGSDRSSEWWRSV